MDKGARITGMLVFIIGTAVLLLVFGMAYKMFTAPIAQFLPAGSTETGMGLGKVLVSILIKVILLFVMTLAGSLVAARGIQLYLGGSEVKK
jgi:hypothetical protein